MKNLKYKRRDELESENKQLKKQLKQARDTIKEYESRFAKAKAYLDDRLSEIK